MAVRRDIAGIVNNDLTFTFGLKYDGAPLDLTTYTVTVTVKPSATSLDSAGTTYALGSGLTMVSLRAGRFKLVIPRAATATAGTLWYRVDVNDGTDINTAVLGSIYLMAA